MGVLSVKRLLQEEHNGERIKDMMETTFFHVKPTDEREHIAKLVDNNNLDIVAVVDNGRLVGCLTEREIAQIIEDENTEDAHMQGASLPLDKPYLEMTSFELWKKRSVWLLLLFVAEAYTSTVIQHFEESLEAAIALAFFIPLLVGTGGNSGNANHLNHCAGHGFGRGPYARCGERAAQGNDYFDHDRVNAGLCWCVPWLDDGDRL
ncbi:Magnesium transporter mgtE [Serratia fonticola]|uniref:Magnesium transporter mgtE n=1 Tax=Serratia fonticola TaxID=47917 RepID=A0A4U9VLZ9_SERFO|nr:Magnesium transporter mgtE [Serratia fonticola]